MQILLSQETQRLLEQRMRRDGCVDPDRAVRTALERLDELDAAPCDGLDAETIAAINEGDAQLDRGAGRPWEELRAELSAKYLGNK